MKKQFLALAFLSTLSGVAYAQSNVSIYGVLDINVTKRTGVDAQFEDYDNNRLGFKGAEDLGNGYKALFQLERRFDLSDGTLGNTNSASWKPGQTKSTKDWEGASNVG
ncbi:MAG: porin, partial [Oxalobacter sp.]|nr:porin [Oxalobacter sp.]